MVRENGVQYVQLNRTSGVRRDVLEAAVGATTLMKRWEGYKRIRLKKLMYIKKLRLLMGKIHSEVSEFKRHFPDVKDDIVPKPRPRAHIRKKVVKHQTYIDKEIDAIKAKLDKLAG